MKRGLVDNGSDLPGRRQDRKAYPHRVPIDFRRPGKPTDNCFIETFDGSLRDECLNVRWFAKMEEAKERIEAGRVDSIESMGSEAAGSQRSEWTGMSERLIWHRSDLGDRLVILERIGGPCDSREGTTWVR